MASYPSFPPVFEPQGPQQQPGQLGAPAPQQQQQQQQHYYHQSAGQLGADQLGAGHLVQPDFYLSLDAFPNIPASKAGPSPVLGHFNLTRNPDADLGALDSPYWPAGVDVASNPSFPPPSSVAQEKVLRHLTNPSPCLSVCQPPTSQPGHLRSAALHCLSPSTFHSPFSSLITPRSLFCSHAFPIALSSCAYLAIGGTACVHFADSLRDAQR